MMTDPIADLLTRIRNAALARHDRTEIPASRLKANVAKILKEEGYIADVRENDAEGKKVLTIVLKYGRDRASAIDGVRRVSRPGAACTSATTTSRARSRASGSRS
jgi:small subunit ribosomal protein S8